MSDELPKVAAGVNFAADVLEETDRIAELLTKQAGVTISRSEVVNRALRLFCASQRLISEPIDADATPHLEAA